MNAHVSEKTLTTADLVAAAKAPQASTAQQQQTSEPAADADTNDSVDDEGRLVALFTPELADDFRSRWDTVQISFVDDPKQAVQKADELVAQVMTSLAETFAKERSELEGFVSGPDSASTENLRVALRRYRSFFQRLLSL